MIARVRVDRRHPAPYLSLLIVFAFFSFFMRRRRRFGRYGYSRWRPHRRWGIYRGQWSSPPIDDNDGD
jgi:hypothetical protein